MAKLPLIDTRPVKDKAARKARTRAPADRAASPRPSKRAVGATERRAAIIAAGLDEFTAKGFAATRLDDVAKRAGVAKGTIYLHFKDKEALFQELVRTALGPLIVRISNPQIGEGAGSARAAIELLAETFARDVIGTKRADIVRMIISEGTRFPQLADFYYREVITHGIAGMRKLIEYGIARGEIRNPALAEFPQLLVGPLVVAVIWQGLFGKQAPLDIAAMLRIHLDLIFSEGKAT
ncbi:MAG: TetR/AcrR family transcriptional regulator [Afipia sp.]|jgi:AcrR family transcriptional regulator|nr:TetR/AcrR family transcriptional regulator [Afipia sp.]MBS4002834.1 TetR/AcrR family transcriptional regulator [Afipia sp.]WIG50190.1 MAG: Transcriptional regulator, AcrR family [Afipia sp.]